MLSSVKRSVSHSCPSRRICRLSPWHKQPRLYKYVWKHQFFAPFQSYGRVFHEDGIHFGVPGFAVKAASQKSVSVLAGSLDSKPRDAKMNPHLRETPIHMTEKAQRIGVSTHTIEVVG